MHLSMCVCSDFFGCDILKMSVKSNFSIVSENLNQNSGRQILRDRDPKAAPQLPPETGGEWWESTRACGWPQGPDPKPGATLAVC